MELEKEEIRTLEALSLMNFLINCPTLRKELYQWQILERTQIDLSCMI